MPSRRSSDSRVNPVVDSRASVRSRVMRRALSPAWWLIGLLLTSGPGVAQTASESAVEARPATATEKDLRELEARIEDLERRLGASALLDLVTRIDRLENDIKQMRDHIEVQERSLDALQGHQLDLYAELDRLARRIATPAPSDSLEAQPEAVGVTGGSAAPGAEDRNGVPDDSVAVEDPRAPDSTGGVAAETEVARQSPSHYDPVEEQAGYQRAFDLLSEGRFERAASAFGAFLEAFPESRYRDDATFWQGECLYALRQFEPALEKFRALVETHAESSRIPGAKLKIGFILHELGQSAEAAEVLRDLVKSAPDSSEAKLASDRLARLE